LPTAGPVVREPARAARQSGARARDAGMHRPVGDSEDTSAPRRFCSSVLRPTPSGPSGDTGTRARTIFGRSNADWPGRTLGSQENYWISWRDPWIPACAGACVAALLGVTLAAIEGLFFLVAHARSSARPLRSARCAAARNRFLRALGWCGAQLATRAFPRAGRAWAELQRALRRAAVACAEAGAGRLLLRGLTRNLTPSWQRGSF